MGANQTSEKFFSELSNLNVRVPIIVMSQWMDPEYSKSICSKPYNIYNTVKKPFSKGQISEILSDLKSNNVMVLDDDEDIQRLIQIDLESAGYYVNLVSNPEEAIELLKVKSFLCGVVDIIMDANKTSDQVIGFIQSDDNELNPGLPLIVTSAFMNKEMEDRFLDKSPLVIDTVKKPFKKGTFSGAINKIKHWKENVDEQIISGVTDEINEERNLVSGEVLEDQSSQTISGGISEDESSQRVSGKIEEDESVTKISGQREDLDEGIQKVTGKIEENNENWKVKSLDQIENEHESGDFNPNERLEDGSTVAMIYALKGDQDGVEKLLALGADLTLKNKSGKGILHFAARSGNTKLVNYLIDQNIKINARDENSREPLFEAVNVGDLEMVKCLVQNGARINSRVMGKSYLIIATLKSNENLVEYFLNVGLDKNIRDTSGKTAIDYAKKIGNEKIINHLSA